MEVNHQTRIQSHVLETHVLGDRPRQVCKLEQFVAGRSRLEDPGAKALAVAIEEMGTLTYISIPQSGITPDGMNEPENLTDFEQE